MLQARDLVLAYALVAVTYVYVGGVFYVTFPFNKNCITDVSGGGGFLGCVCVCVCVCLFVVVAAAPAAVVVVVTFVVLILSTCTYYSFRYAND